MTESFPPYLPERLKRGPTVWVSTRDFFAPHLTVLTIHSIATIVAASEAGSTLTFPIYSRTNDMPESDPDDELGTYVFSAITDVSQNRESDAINFLATVKGLFGMQGVSVWTWNYTQELGAAAADFGDE